MDYRAHRQVDDRRGVSVLAARARKSLHAPRNRRVRLFRRFAVALEEVLESAEVVPAPETPRAPARARGAARRCGAAGRRGGAAVKRRRAAGKRYRATAERRAEAALPALAAPRERHAARRSLRVRAGALGREAKRGMTISCA